MILLSALIGLVEDGQSDLSKREHTVFGPDRPIAKLKSLERRHLLSVGNCCQDAAR